jgi:hypothetical protein
MSVFSDFKKLHLFFSKTHNVNAYLVLTTALQCVKTQKPYTLAGFEPGMFCSVGIPDDYYDTPPAAFNEDLLFIKTLYCVQTFSVRGC